MAHTESREPSVWTLPRLLALITFVGSIASLGLTQVEGLPMENRVTLAGLGLGLFVGSNVFALYAAWTDKRPS